MHEILFVSLGLTVLDEIRIPSQEPLLNVLGGSGVYASLGARLFLPEAEARSLGWILHIGKDFPTDLEDELSDWDTSLVIDRKRNEPCTRGLLEYNDNVFGHKTFRYTTTPLKIKTDKLSTHALFMAKSFHFLDWPRDLEERVRTLLELRKQNRNKNQRRMIIWEPVPLSCEQDHLISFLSAVKVVDVFSPNHLELLEIFGEQHSNPFRREQVEDLARIFLDSGVGPDRTGSVIIRAGEHGSMAMGPDGICHWMPPYYLSLTKDKGLQSSKVVDATGAGNAFLGAYAIGYLKTGDVNQAACYGSVAASFALEQIGVPRRIVKNGQEEWNGSSVYQRLKEYMDRL